MDPQPERLALVEQPEPLSIAALYRQVQAAVAASFPRGHLQWVRGEIQSISDRTGHCYMDLVDPDAVRGRDTPVLKVNCWGRTWGPLKATLGRQGIILEPGVVVSLRGRVEFYPPKGQVNFIATDVDVTALLGRLAARRAALLHTLETEGLLRRNQALAVPTVPLRIGLVASPGTEGHNDFVGQLHRSDVAFAVVLFKANVQGAGAPASIARALRALAGSDCDVGVLVRGGGSKGDLAAFDAEPVARAIATLPIPLWTGIGHTGDRSVADIVANNAFVTPTACAQELVRRVQEFWESVASSAARASDAAPQTRWRLRRHATRRRDAGSARPHATSCHGIPNVWSTEWRRSPPTRAGSSTSPATPCSAGQLGSARAPWVSSTATKTTPRRGDDCWRPTTSSANSSGVTPSRCDPTAAWCVRWRSSMPDPR